MSENMKVTAVTFPENRWKTYKLEKEVTMKKGWSWQLNYDNSVSFFNSKGKLVKTVKVEVT